MLGLTTSKSAIGRKGITMRRVSSSGGWGKSRKKKHRPPRPYGKAMGILIRGVKPRRGKPNPKKRAEGRNGYNRPVRASTSRETAIPTRRYY